MRPLIFALVLAGCGTTDPRCSVANCEVALGACDATIPGLLSDVVCVAGGLTPPPDRGADRAVRCAEACGAGHNGALLACIVALELACTNAVNSVERFQVVSTCTAPRADLNCERACTSALAPCRTRCPMLPTWGACTDCLRDCGLRAASCWAGC